MPSVSQTMIAVEISRPGGPDVLRAVERPVPRPGPGEVLIRVAAAGVNRPDIAQREGRYPPPPGASDLPGLEISGTVVEAGPRVDSQVGGDVCALLAGGGYAQYAVAPVAQVLPVPARVSTLSAAGIPETFFTVWSNVMERGALKAGETFLVHGGASGIGTTAIQVARAFGARVFTTAGSAAKCAVCEQLGAERAVNYKADDFVEVVRQLTAGRGVDLILDMVGGDYIPRNLDALATDGRLVQIAFLRGSRVELNVATIMQRRLTVTGSTLRPRTVDEKGAIARALLERVWPLLADGHIRPIIDRTFTLARAADAHRYLEAGDHIGKVLLTT
jgi:putative PIG3 family NAD(P)H quinone oxidoreductase